VCTKAKGTEQRMDARVRERIVGIALLFPVHRLAFPCTKLFFCWGGSLFSGRLEILGYLRCCGGGIVVFSVRVYTFSGAPVYG
jgi:hypothetical protein